MVNVLFTLLYRFETVIGKKGSRCVCFAARGKIADTTGQNFSSTHAAFNLRIQGAIHRPPGMAARLTGNYIRQDRAKVAVCYWRCVCQIVMGEIHVHGRRSTRGAITAGKGPLHPALGGVNAHYQLAAITVPI